MGNDLTNDFWERFNKLSVTTGGLALLLVYLAGAKGENFDWTVLLLSGGAALACWWRSEFLVPAYKRHGHAEDEMWQRFNETDWRFVSSVSDLSGTELDDLRMVFRQRNDAKARHWIETHWPAMTHEDVQGFLRFLNTEFMDTISAYIGDDGRLYPMD